MNHIIFLVVGIVVVLVIVVVTVVVLLQFSKAYFRKISFAMLFCTKHGYICGDYLNKELVTSCNNTYFTYRKIYDVYFFG